jgi:Bacterial type II/III secretion system short domain
MLAAKPRLIFVIIVLVLCGAWPVAAQQQQPAPQYVENTGFKNRVFEIKYRDPESLERVIKLLTSGFKGASISADRAYRTLTVRDFPENIAAIEDALKRLDTPEAARPEIELHMHVLIASNTEVGAGAVPAELKDVITQLQNTLSYKNYYLLTSIIQRTKERPGYSPDFMLGEGMASMTVPGASDPRVFHYTFQSNSLTLGQNTAGATTVELGRFNFALEGDFGRAGIRSDVGVREGEKVVVGTAGLRDRALILVLTAKLIK